MKHTPCIRIRKPINSSITIHNRQFHFNLLDKYSNKYVSWSFHVRFDAHLIYMAETQHYTTDLCIGFDSAANYLFAPTAAHH